MKANAKESGEAAYSFVISRKASRVPLMSWVVEGRPRPWALSPDGEKGGEGGAPHPHPALLVAGGDICLLPVRADELDHRHHAAPFCWLAIASPSASMTAEASAFEMSLDDEMELLPSRAEIQPRRDSLSVIPSSLKEAWIFLSCASVTGSAGGILGGGVRAFRGIVAPGRTCGVNGRTLVDCIGADRDGTDGLRLDGVEQPHDEIRGDQPEGVSDGPPTQHLASVPLPRAAGLNESGLAGIVDGVGARDPFVAAAQGDGAGITGFVEGFEPDPLAFGEGQLQLDAHRQPAADEGHRA